MESHCTQVVLPPSPNRTLFIAMTFQSPMSLKATKRTISSRDLENRSPKRNFVWDPIAEAAQKKRIMRRIRKRQEKPAENHQESCHISDYYLSRAPRAAERDSV